MHVWHLLSLIPRACLMVAGVGVVLAGEQAQGQQKGQGQGKAATQPPTTVA
jgi:hypothetical protein